MIKKYTDIARSTAEEEKLDAADGDDDDDDKDEEDDDIVDEEEKFENSKRKLRLVLCQADFQNLPMVHSENRIPEKRLALNSCIFKSFQRTFHGCNVRCIYSRFSDRSRIVNRK